jgi:hypothetical protein
MANPWFAAELRAERDDPGTRPLAADKACARAAPRLHVDQLAGHRGHAHRVRARGAAKLRAGADDWANAFLEAFESTGMVSAACAAAGVGRTTVYRRRQQDESFAVAWHDLEEDIADQLEGEAFRRAVKGTEKPITVAGEREAIREYSDKLLIVLLRARRPALHRDNFQIEHAGHVEHEHVYNPEAVELSAELRERVRRILDGDGVADDDDVIEDNGNPT